MFHSPKGSGGRRGVLVLLEKADAALCCVRFCLLSRPVKPRYGEEEQRMITEFLVKVDDMVWGVPLIVLILACGVWLTIRTGLLQVRHLGKALRFMVKNEEGGRGEVTSFGAPVHRPVRHHRNGQYCGRSLRHCLRRPGALLWMELAAFFGMATKYAEGLLAIRYRTIEPDGHVLGGALLLH